jgi:hypothetical protein
LIVQGIKNAVDSVINGDNGKFDQILSPGSAKVISDVIGCRFNMDGAKPTGCMVGLIDEYHIWGFLMDPFNYEGCIIFVIDGNMIQTYAKNIIAYFVPANGTRRNESIRNNLLSEFEVRSACAFYLLFSFTFYLMVLADLNRNFSLTLATGPVYGTTQFQRMALLRQTK